MISGRRLALSGDLQTLFIIEFQMLTECQWTRKMLLLNWLAKADCILLVASEILNGIKCYVWKRTGATSRACSSTVSLILIVLFVKNCFTNYPVINWFVIPIILLKVWNVVFKITYFFRTSLGISSPISLCSLTRVETWNRGIVSSRVEVFALSKLPSYLYLVNWLNNLYFLSVW